MVILYGAGAWAQAAYDFIQKIEDVVCFLDKDPALEGRMINGLPVYNPEKIDDKRKKYDVVVCIVAAPYNEILEYLMRLGYNKIYSLIDYVEINLPCQKFGKFLAW